MKFELFEASGYKRLALAGINKITITPENKFHWILGTNGSGKSSLIKEFSPLAATPNDYKKGGYKLIHIKDKDKFYKLKSDFSGPKNIFSFILIESNGEERELNPGHTSTVFNNLVFQYFNYTKEIHEFCLGKKNFTTMSPNESKSWLTRLSQVDYTFALNYFKRLFSRYKDLQGSIRTDQERLIEARGKLLSEAEINALKTHLEILKERQNFFIENTPNPSTPYEVVKNKASDFQQRLVRIREEQSNYLRSRLQLQPLGEQVDLVERNTFLKEKIISLDTVTKIKFEELEKTQKILDDHYKVHSLNSLDIENAIVRLRDEITTNESSLTYVFAKDPNAVSLQFQSWLSELNAVVEHLVPDLNEECNPDNFQVVKHRYENLQNFITQGDIKLTDLQRKLEEAKDHTHSTAMECPQCQHQWIPGKTQADIHKLETLLIELQEKLLKSRKEHEIIYEDLHKQVKFQEGMGYLKDFVWKYESFKGFWEFIFSNKIHRLEPNSINQLAFNYGQEVQVMVKIDQDKKALEDLNQKLELLNKTSNHNVDHLIQTLDTLDKELSDLYNQRESAWKERRRTEAKIEVFEYLQKTNEETKRLKEAMDQNFILEFEHFQRGQLSDFSIQNHQDILQVEKQLRNIDVQNAQIEIMEKQIEEAREFSKVLKAAVDELSPSTGLIAKGLMGFINHFIQMVNKIIAKVWLYPMELALITPDEDNEIELDYKFSVMVKEEKVPELSECSSGQQEIINLAMRIVSLTFLQLDKGPLFLDEFGARMDTAHKASAFDMISKLLVTSNFSQIFMISHFEGTHTQGLEADITVLCNANIQLPAGVTVNKQTLIA